MSTRFLNVSLQIAFPNNVLLIKFHDECKSKQSLSERLEERGGVSRSLSHLKENDTTQAVFDRVKKLFFYTTNEKFEPNVVIDFSLRLNLWKIDFI